MKPKYGIDFEYGEKPKTFDEKMKDGADIGAGIAQSMPMRKEYDRPYTTQVHETTREERDEKY